MPEDSEGLFYARLRHPPPNGTVAEIINRLSTNDKVDICQQLDLCIPNVYPFLFDRRTCNKVKICIYIYYICTGNFIPIYFYPFVFHKIISVC